jgi:hypothetical protein
MVIHSKLKPDYTPPDIPEGFDQLSAMYHPDGDVIIDFINHEKRDFAYADESGIDFEWPWVDDFKPQPEDWKAIDFHPLW